VVDRVPIQPYTIQWGEGRSHSTAPSVWGGLYATPFKDEIPLRTVFCSGCGDPLPDDAKFCSSCGFAATPDEEAATTTETKSTTADSVNDEIIVAMQERDKQNRYSFIIIT